MVIFGILTDSSIGGLLIAGVIPGVSCSPSSSAVPRCSRCGGIRNTRRAPSERYTLAEKLYSLRLAGPLVLVIASIILGLYMGVFTPTEAGGMGAAVTLVLAVIRQRGFKGLKLLEILRETVKTSAMIFAIIICALIFSRFLALSGVANTLGDFLTGLNVNRWVIVLIIVVIYLIFGMMMDAPALLAITLPITHPVMMKLGFDPIWFGVFVVLLVELGAVTPPVGVNCFVVQATSEGRVELEDVFSGLIPYVLAGFVMLLLLCLFPQLALYLPQIDALTAMSRSGKIRPAFDRDLAVWPQGAHGDRRAGPRRPRTWWCPPTRSTKTIRCANKIRSAKCPACCCRMAARSTTAASSSSSCSTLPAPIGCSRAEGPARFKALTLARLADGITEAAILMVYEGRFRDANKHSERWLSHQRGKILRALAAFEAAPPDAACHRYRRHRFGLRARLSRLAEAGGLAADLSAACCLADGLCQARAGFRAHQGAGQLGETKKMQTYLASPSRPKLKLPAGACDAHVHVMGPESRFPFANVNLTKQDAPKEKLFALHDVLGIEHCVIVHTTSHGHDNSATADALAAKGGAYRGVALVETNGKRRRTQAA